jgi:hypothetical protein
VLQELLGGQTLMGTLAVAVRPELDERGLVDDNNNNTTPQVNLEHLQNHVTDW